VVLCVAVVTLAALGAPFEQTGASSPARHGCDRYAAPGGSNAARGTWSRPVRTVQRLVNTLHPGQTGCLRHGVYRSAKTNVTKRHITLKPYRFERVTLRGDIKVLPTGRRAVIAGMRLNGAGGANKIGPRIYASRVVLRDNKITNDHTGICVLITRYFHRPAPDT
jgi:hypothetical protein